MQNRYEIIHMPSDDRVSHDTYAVFDNLTGEYCEYVNESTAKIECAVKNLDHLLLQHRSKVIDPIKYARAHAEAASHNYEDLPF